MHNFISLLRKSLHGLSRYQTVLLAGWLVLMVSIPLLRRFIGERVFLQALALFVLIQVLFVLRVLYSAWGWWSTLRVAVGVVLFAWVAQAIGVRSGYPFGHYRFTPALQPQVMDVPLLIPLMWLMMLPSAWAIAKLISRRVSGCLARPLFVIISALAFTAWAFYLEPQMVQWGLLQWTSPGGYFGIPWISFLGWFLVSAIISLAVSPRRMPGGLLVVVYSLTWLLQLICQVVLTGLIGPAVAGFFAMGSMLFAAALQTR